MSSEYDISILLRAAYPIICVYSYEERRVEASIVKLANGASSGGTPVYYWSITEGLGVAGPLGIQSGRANDDLCNPMAVLDHIGDSGEPGVFILRDFHNYIEGSAGATVQRKLKDLAYFLTTEAVSRHIVIVGHYFEIPPSLEKIAAVVDFDLPDQSELSEVIENSLKDAGLEKVWDDLKSDKEVLQSVSQSTKGLTRFEVENVVAKSLVSKGKIDINTILSEKKHIIKKSGVLEYYEPSCDMSLIGGLDNLKSWLSARGKAFSSKARDYGLPLPKGVLIVGVPGTGKSLISKAVGIAWSMPVLRLDIGALFGSFVGQSEANMRKALKTAEALAPCVLWIDELEKGLAGAMGGNDGGTSSRVFGSFLSWMQEKTSPVFVVATANNVSALPPEMLRKGRFDEIFFSDLPTREEREDILKIHINRFNRSCNDYDVRSVSLVTDGFSGAELEQVVIDSLFSGFSENREPTIEDMLSAASVTVPLSVTMSNQLRDLRDWAKSRARKAGKDPVPASQPLRNARKTRMLS